MTADENLLGIYRQVVPNHQVAILRHANRQIMTFSTGETRIRMETTVTRENVIYTRGAWMPFEVL
jgi:hypothetical protein